VNLLLDTHSFLWFVTNDAKLSATAGNAIRDPANEVFVSPASYWEIAIKVGAGRYRINGPFEEFWNAGIYLNDFHILPITPLHAAVLSSLPLHHKDPFDRMLVAQATVDDAAIVSVDKAIDAYVVSRVW
jgi:PIN domain nuclease of toxin-antitoxin system